MGFRLGAILTEGRWESPLKVLLNLELCDLCPLQRKGVSNQFLQMTDVAEHLGHSGENHKDIAVSKTQWVWQEVYKFYKKHNLWLADNEIWERKNYKEELI